MLRVDLGEAKYLRVRQRTAVLLLQSVQVFNLLGREGQTLLLVVLFQIVHILDGLRLDIDRKDVLIQTMIGALQHGVVGILWHLIVSCQLSIVNWKVFLDTADALEAHVLGNLDGIGRPRGHHLTTRTYEIAIQLF